MDELFKVLAGIITDTKENWIPKWKNVFIVILLIFALITIGMLFFTYKKPELWLFSQIWEISFIIFSILCFLFLISLWAATKDKINENIKDKLEILVFIKEYLKNDENMKKINDAWYKINNFRSNTNKDFITIVETLYPKMDPLIWFDFIKNNFYLKIDNKNIKEVENLIKKEKTEFELEPKDKNYKYITSKNIQIENQLEFIISNIKGFKFNIE